MPEVSASRMARRVDMLRKAGFQPEALAFERDSIGGRAPDCPVETMGRIYPGRYFNRVIRLMKAVPQARAAMRHSDLAYAFNLDMALLAWIAGAGLKKPIVLEVGDIREVQTTGGITGRLVRAVDRIVTGACRLLVLTTRGYRAYYRDWLRVNTPDLVIENKLDPSFASATLRCFTHLELKASHFRRPLRIGYFGRLRDAWSLQVLESVAQSTSGKFEIVLAGSPRGIVKGLSQRVREFPNVEYLGAYRYPDDLTGLYSSVDLVMSCYPPDVPLGWSQTNRYYEACLFRKPLLVRNGTGDAEQVLKHDIGLILTESDARAAATQIDAISTADLSRWQRNMKALPESVFSAEGDAQALRCVLAPIMRT